MQHAAGDVGPGGLADRPGGLVELAGGEAGDGAACRVVQPVGLAEPEGAAHPVAEVRQGADEQLEQPLGRADRDPLLAVEHDVAVEHGEEAGVEGQPEGLARQACGRPPAATTQLDGASE